MSRSRRATSTSTADGPLASHPYTLLDVFTAAPLAGNGLAVVHDADGLDEQTMLAFALETRLSETTFVQTPTETRADYRNRIFTTGGEIPFAGHPSLGTAVAVALERGVAAGEFVQQTEAGLQPIRIEIDGVLATASMLQAPAEFGPELAPAEALAPFGLGEEDADPQRPPQIVSTGVPQLLIPVRAEALARVKPDYGRIPGLLSPHSAITAYLAAIDGGQVRARSFGFTPGMGEDPATGSAAGPLMAYLHAREGAEAVEIRQGVEMGRPSLLHAAIEGGRVRVSGQAVVLVRGTLTL